MLVLDSNNLVPVKDLTDGRFKGLKIDTARLALAAGEVEPATAEQLKSEGLKFHEIPDGYTKPEPDAGFVPRPPVPARTADPTVAIPDDWKDQHWMKKVRLVEQITGKPVDKHADKTAAQVADEFLEAEVKRRADAKAAGEQNGGGEPSQ